VSPGQGIGTIVGFSKKKKFHGGLSQFRDLVDDLGLAGA
jgi:hypothetical protein